MRLCRPGKSWHHGDDGGPFVWSAFKSIGQFNIFPCRKGSLFIFQRSLKIFQYSSIQAHVSHIISDYIHLHISDTINQQIQDTH